MFNQRFKAAYRKWYAARVAMDNWCEDQDYLSGPIYGIEDAPGYGPPERLTSVLDSADDELTAIEDGLIEDGLIQVEEHEPTKTRIAVFGKYTRYDYRLTDSHSRVRRCFYA
jgi:hypothetical protein